MSRDYIKINNVSSLTITGLAIKSMPPIVKPPMRTLIEEIDGRNGDIITELGYGAYDKTIEIGLYGNYNIDKVIAFFNSKGTIEFSNELGKIYNFSIAEQIDFESLLKFREATITIHVQPFKYPTSETAVSITTTTAQTITNSGNIYSKPILDIKGTGVVGVKLGGTQILEVDCTNNSEIIIDTEILEAYTPQNVLANRDITGDYDSFRLEVGNNTIQFTGDFTSATITKYSRWL